MKRKTIGWIGVGLAVAIMLYLVVGAVYMVFIPWQDHRLDDYSCEQLSEGLMSGDSVKRATHRYRWWPFYGEDIRMYELNDVYVHYSFRCEKGEKG